MEELSEKIYEQAINLPVDERLILIEKLLISTNLSTQKDIDDAWSAEVEHRCETLDSGETKLASGDEVFEKVRKLFSK
ncbi:MAG: addiction module protein [Desulfobacterales bacterium]|nr:addiction module protein [Desulfobacterales bacterium]